MSDVFITGQGTQNKKSGFVVWWVLLLLGLAFGGIGGWVGDMWAGVSGTAVLAGLFSAYNRLLKRNEGLFSGLIVGVLLGGVVGLMGIIFPGHISDIRSGITFAVLRGFLIGAVIGLISRAEYDKNDNLPTRIFLFVGSIFLGAVLAAGVGLITGSILGVIAQISLGVLIATTGGAIVCGYIGAYKNRPRSTLLGLLGGAILGLGGFVLGGAFGGLILGAISGAFAPMLLVSSISAFGGLTSRGFKAMIVEALEAPKEMMEQGAVPFLVPAVITGGIIGAAAAGPASLITLPAGLGLLGMAFGAFGDIDSRPDSRVTPRSIIEMGMMGTTSWPVGRVIQQLTSSRRQAIAGAGVGVLIGIVGSSLGYVAGQWLAQMLTGVA